MNTNAKMPTNKNRKVGSYIYPVRIIGYFLAITTLLLFHQYHPDSHYHHWALYGFCIFLLLYPHLAFVYYRLEGYQRQAEFKALVMDMFLIAWINFFLDFSPIYGLPFFISNSATNYATNGIKLFGSGLLAFVLGCILSLSFGFHYHFEFNIWIAIPSFTYLLLATHYIGFVSHSRGHVLQKVKFILEHHNNKLERQQEEIQEKNKALEVAQKDIEEGMAYAHDIQRAILPQEQEIKEIFSNYMVLFRPKDIISGDFYWLHRTGSLKILIVADCTGHGVPGAFVSLIGQMFLNEIIIEKRIYAPNEILEAVHRKVAAFLNQENNRNQDGMDMSILCVDLEQNLVTFSAAKHSLVMIQNNVSKIIRGDFLSIGGERYIENAHFKNQVLPLEEKTRFYLFSDGVCDQFGGKKNKKLGKNRLMQTLTSLQQLPLPEQSTALETFLNNWMQEGKEEQIDDMVVFGVEIIPMQI